MFCSNCGQHIENKDGNFCNKCGAALTKEKNYTKISNIKNASGTRPSLSMKIPFFVVVGAVALIAALIIFTHIIDNEDTVDFSIAENTAEFIAEIIEDEDIADSTLAENILEITAEIGDIIQFGDYYWRVLDVEENYALILSEYVIRQMAYYDYFPIDEWASVTWETSDVRHYLNNDFLQRFTLAERSIIRESFVVNDDNPWIFAQAGFASGRATFNTAGGNNTYDYIFLLSINEVTEHFGGTELVVLGKIEDNRIGAIPGLGVGAIWEDNAISRERIANDIGGIPVNWWLRSPGHYSNLAAIVCEHGSISIGGAFVDNIALHGGLTRTPIGLRPAMWIRLS